MTRDASSQVDTHLEHLDKRHAQPRLSAGVVQSTNTSACNSRQVCSIAKDQGPRKEDTDRDDRFEEEIVLDLSEISVQSCGSTWIGRTTHRHVDVVQTVH